MAEMSSDIDFGIDQNAIADLTKKMKKATEGTAKLAAGKFFTPFKIACLALATFVLANIGWAMVFGDLEGGQPNASQEINWSRTEKTTQFMPDFGSKNKQTSTPNSNTALNPNLMAVANDASMPRITASGTSKVIHLPSVMAEAVPEDFATNGKLVRAPVEAITQFTKFGKLPIIGPQGEKASEVYARPSPAFDGRPRIAIMITGLGIHHEATKTAIDSLPGQISFGFSPYGQGLQDWINRARENGHEVVLQAPMEPFDYPDNDPGPSTLLADGDLAVNMSRFKWILSRITGYIGITNFMGAKFTSKEKAITPILKELKKRGLYYIENGVLHRSKVSQISNQLNLGYSKVDVIIDAKNSIENIENSLEEIERIATTTGMAFAIGSNLPATVEYIKNWADTLEAKGYQLVPVSAKVKRQQDTNITKTQ